MKALTIREHGLRAQDIAIIPAAAGGPKGLIFQKMDQCGPMAVRQLAKFVENPDPARVQPI